MALTLEVNGKQYLFPEPKVTTYLIEGIMVKFVDESAIYCDNVTGGCLDTCVWWRNSQIGSLVGDREGVYTREDYINYCCSMWLGRVESKISAADYYGSYIKEND